MEFSKDMTPRRLPIFIATPFIGQGDILNEEWIDGRIALFEAVTKNSLLNLLDEDVHWLIFLGRKPTQKVVIYAEKVFGGIENIHVQKVRFDANNINSMAKQISPVERYIATIIADDDAWPNDYISTVREKANDLLNAGDEHAGMAFANGLEWVMSDQVDIHFLQKSGFNILRKQNMVNYRYPWLGCGFFVLQTKDRPFTSICNAHETIPKWLEEQGFSVHVSEEPKRAWLYNRHQLSASSLVKSENEPLDFSLAELEEEFGIDAAKVAAWSSSRFSSYYSEKAQGVGMLDMYEFPNLDDFVHMPFKSFFFNNEYLVIDTANQFNIRGPCRVRIYNITTKQYEILFNFNSVDESKMRLHKSMFNQEQEYKFDVQKSVDGTWTRVMPYVFIKFKELDHPLTIEKEMESILSPRVSSPEETKCRVVLTTKDSSFRLELPAKRFQQCILDSSLLSSTLENTLTIHIMRDGQWELESTKTL